jgi:hypothetical protein
MNAKVSKSARSSSAAMSNVTVKLQNMSNDVVFYVKNEVYYNLRHNTFMGKNMETTEIRPPEKTDEELIMSIIENASNSVRNAYNISQWITIQQGNDSY